MICKNSLRKGKQPPIIEDQLLKEKETSEHTLGGKLIFLSHVKLLRHVKNNLCNYRKEIGFVSAFIYECVVLRLDMY